MSAVLSGERLSEESRFDRGTEIGMKNHLTHVEGYLMMRCGGDPPHPRPIPPAPALISRVESMLHATSTRPGLQGGHISISMALCVERGVRNTRSLLPTCPKVPYKLSRTVVQRDGGEVRTQVQDRQAAKIR